MLGGGFDGFDGGERGHHAALFFSGGVACGCEDGRRFVRACRVFRCGRAFCGAGFPAISRAKAIAPCEKIAFDQAIDDAELQRFFGFDGTAAGAHFDCFGDACETR